VALPMPRPPPVKRATSSFKAYGERYRITWSTVHNGTGRSSLQGRFDLLQRVAAERPPGLARPPLGASGPSTSADTGGGKKGEEYC
jgi:hypothetical protein